MLNLLYRKLPKDFTWRGTWRGTYLNIPTSKFASLDCSRLYSDTFHRPFYCAHISLTPYIEGIPPRNQIARLPDLTPAEYEKSWLNKPFILTEPVKSWPLYKTWSLETLAEKYAETNYRIDVVDWPFKTYVDYMKDNSDESPMYLFDSEFVGKMGLKTEGENADYIPPPAFGVDFFDVFGAQRPDYQWLIIGPERSGSPFHKDPNATSAWNAVITGAKYWIMFPGDTVPPGIYISDDGDVTSPLSNAEWLLNFHAAARKAPGCMEGICDEGEVLHIPSGWWHLVVNLSPAIAVTENFVPRGHLASALDFLKNKADQITGFKKDVVDPYALFVGRMADTFPDILEEGMKELEAKRKKRKWEDVVKHTEDDEAGEGGGFSFGFGGDDSDAEVP